MNWLNKWIPARVGDLGFRDCLRFLLMVSPVTSVPQKAISSLASQKSVGTNLSLGRASAFHAKTHIVVFPAYLVTTYVIIQIRLASHFFPYLTCFPLCSLALCRGPCLCAGHGISFFKIYVLSSPRCFFKSMSPRWQLILFPLNVGKEKLRGIVT